MQVTTLRGVREEQFGLTRTINRVSSAQIHFDDPQGRSGTLGLDLPKTATFRVDGPSEFTVLDRDGTPALSYRIETPESLALPEDERRREIEAFKDVWRADQEARKAAHQARDAERSAAWQAGEPERERERQEREAAREAEKAERAAELARLRSEARAQGKFAWDDEGDRSQVEPFYDEYLSLYEEELARLREKRAQDAAHGRYSITPMALYEGFDVDDAEVDDRYFRGSLGSLAGVVDEDRAISALQGLRRERKGQERLEALVSEGYAVADKRLMEPIEGGNGSKRLQGPYKSVIVRKTEGGTDVWREYPGARLVIGENGEIEGVMRKGKSRRYFSTHESPVLLRDA